MEYKLSPSSLNLLEDCPRCFWLHMVEKIKRPMGPMSSIPIKMDSIIKHYFDRYREQGILPPIVLGQIEGKLALDMPKTLKLEMDDRITLWGRPDDYFELNDGDIVAFDHKTKSKEPEDVHKSYQLQLDVYSFLLKNLDYRIKEETELPVALTDDPLTTVVLGTGKVLLDRNLLKQIAVE